jgi:voltage-gated potassium channel
MQPSLKRPPKARYIALIGFIVLAIGIVFYRIVEGFSWINSLYFCVITLTTIGYGDIVPKTDIGKLFTTVYVIIGIGIFAAVINYLIKRAAVQRISKRQEDQDKKNK